MTHVPLPDRLKIGIAAVAWFLLGLLFMLGLPVLTQLPTWVLGIAAACALLLALLAYGLWGLLRRGSGGWRWAPYLTCSVASVLAVGAAMGFPVYFLSYQVEVDPVVMPQATLSNGHKTVVFQGMVHIGSENFYKSVVYDLETALAGGYRLYYEGVRGSTPEGDRWFSNTLAAGGDLDTRYKDMANACGLHYQIDYFGLLANDMRAHPDRHLTADVSTVEMKAEYDRLMQSDPAFAAQVATKATKAPGPTAAAEPDPITRLISWHQHGSNGQKSIAGIVCRGIFTMALATSDNQPASGIDKVIIDFRNRHLAERILGDSYDKIYITYGARHLTGVLAALQASDPGWKVQSVKWVRAIAKPEHFEREL